MEFDSIKELIEKQEIGAITLDTSIFDNQSLKLESGFLKQLEQFSDGPTKVIISEVVKTEVFIHLQEKAKTTYTEIDKNLSEAQKYCQLEDDIDEIKKYIFKGGSPQEIASNRLKKFIDITSSEIIETQDYVALNQVLEKYFQNKPPFDKKDKKCEFPDAIALMSLESWAKENVTKVLVISIDDDWKRYCKDSENLIFIDSISNCLELFQKIKSYDICSQLSKKYYDGHLDFLKDAIDSALADGIYDFDIYVEASSAYQYEDEINDRDYEGFEFKIIKKPDVIFRPIKFDNDTLVIEAKLTVDVNIECSFYFMHWDSIDKDYVGMGGTSVSKKTNLDVNILVTLIDESSQFDEDIEVHEVEITTTKETVDFDYIEPDWMSESDDE